jgi:23S rRNA pseudouridine1911/1915/1917 synthase
MADASGAAPRRVIFLLEEAEAGRRVDRVAAERLPDLSRSRIQHLIANDLVTLNGRPVRASQPVHPGDHLEVVIPPPASSELLPEEIPLQVVYEDADVVVIDKPAGLVVHPAAGHPSGTLVNALLARYPDLAVGGTLRPGIVHRLDRFTSGLIVVARHDAAHQSLLAQQKQRTMVKAYLVLVDGHMPAREGVIEAPIGRHPHQRKQMAVVAAGRPARTAYCVVEELGPYSLVEARLETGRTHQIRVHFTHSGHPVLGDPTYGRRAGVLGLTRQFLHAYRLGFHLPSSGEFREFESPLPPDLTTVLERLRRRYHQESGCGPAS